MGYQAKARNEKKGGKCDAVEYPKYHHKREDRTRKDRRALLWCLLDGFRKFGQSFSTLFSTIRWIKTRLHATANVSIEFENVCVWYVHVTYEDATSKIATLR